MFDTFYTASNATRPVVESVLTLSCAVAWSSVTLHEDKSHYAQHKTAHSLFQITCKKATVWQSMRSFVTNNHTPQIKYLSGDDLTDAASALNTLVDANVSITNERKITTYDLLMAVFGNATSQVVFKNVKCFVEIVESGISAFPYKTWQDDHTPVCSWCYDRYKMTLTLQFYNQ